MRKRREVYGTFCCAECLECGAIARGVYSMDDERAESSAAKIWNRRAERTCRISVEKRKVSQTQTAVVKSCSECGFEYGVETENSFPFEVTIGAVEPPNFCPNCGAKAVENA